MTSAGGEDDLGRQLQPHLASAAELDKSVSVNDADVKVNVGEDSPGKKTTAPPTWERFDDDDDKNRPVASGNVPVTQNASSPETSGPVGESQAANGKTSASDSSASKTSATGQQPPVMYNSQSGEAMVVMAGNVGYTVGSPPAAVIETRHLPERWRDTDQPLTSRRMKVLMVLSVIAAILFFPTGIPALVFARRTKQEFDKGILQGNIDLALRFARRCERLIILSAILLVLVVVLVFAVVERAANGSNLDHSYVAHSSVQG